MKNYTVQQGDDIETVAFENGILPERIWDLDENEELRELRVDPCLLRPGDEIVIPDAEPKDESLPTGERHVFRRKGAHGLRIAFTQEDELLADVPFVLKLETRDGAALREITSTTNADGELLEIIPANAMQGEVVLNPGEEAEQVIPIRLGNIDPLDEGFLGAQAMLNNLGYFSGNEDDGIGDVTRAAVRAFQEDNCLELLPEDATEIDEFTLAAIEEAYFLPADASGEDYEDGWEDEDFAADLDAEEEEELSEEEEDVPSPGVE